MNDNLLSRFLRYVQLDTQSDETSNTYPSTPGQLVLLEMLKEELSELGAADVQMSFPLEAATARGGMENKLPAIADFLKRIHARPAYQRALERGGKYEIVGGD